MSKIRRKKVYKDGHPQKVAIFYLSHYSYSMYFQILFLLLISPSMASVVPLSDNILFGFDKCKMLTVNLERGHFIEAPLPGIDLHCKKSISEKLEFECSFYDQDTNEIRRTEKFSGGSHLGAAELKNKDGSKIKFLIGKKFASYESGVETKACAGIFIFEQDALKQKPSSPKSD